MEELRRDLRRNCRYRRDRGGVRVDVWHRRGIGHRSGRSGGAELEQLHVPVAGDEDVGRLQVRVDDPAPVRGDQRVGDLQPEIDDAFRRRRTVGRQHLVQRASFEQLADEKRLTVDLA